MTHTSDKQASTTTGQIPAVERMGLRTMEARIEWWVESARAAVVPADADRLVA